MNIRASSRAEPEGRLGSGGQLSLSLREGFVINRWEKDWCSCKQAFCTLDTLLRGVVLLQLNPWVRLVSLLQECGRAGDGAAEDRAQLGAGTRHRRLQPLQRGGTHHL